MPCFLRGEGQYEVKLSNRLPAVSFGQVLHRAIERNQSERAPDDFTSGVHCAICAWINARYSAGPVAAISIASPFRRSRTSGLDKIRVVSACSFSTIARGVFAGACRP